jgi:hypothetical protein
MQGDDDTVSRDVDALDQQLHDAAAPVFTLHRGDGVRQTPAQVE